MKKISGKALSLVLSLALVVSSFSVSLASAAAASETATASLADGSLYLANGGAGNTLKFELVNISSSQSDGTDYLALAPASTGTLYDHQLVSNLTLKDVAITNGSGIATVKVTKDTSGNVTGALLTLTNASVQGTVNVVGRYEGTVQRGTNTDASNVYAQATLTVTVLKNGSTVIGKGVASSNAATALGSYPDALDSLSKTVGSISYGIVETVSTDTASAEAKWALGTVESTIGSHADGSFGITASGVHVTVASVETGKAFSLTTVLPTGAVAPNAFSSYGSVSVAAQKYTGTTPVASTNALDKATATTSVTNTVTATSSQDTISVYQGVTYLHTDVVDGTTGKAPSDAVNVTGANVDLSANTALVTVYGGSVGKLTVGTAGLTVEDGTIAGGISTSGDVTVTKGSISGITIPDADPAITGKTITVNGGTVGDITDTDGTNSVVILSNDDTLPILVGNVTAQAISVDSNGNAAVKTGNIKTNADGTITLSGDKVTVGQIDCNYKTDTLTLNGFKGTIAAPLNTYTPGLNSSAVFTTLNVVNGATINSDAVISGTPFFNAVTLTSGTLTFSGAAKIGAAGISGAGTLQVAPNALYAQGPVAGIYLKLTKDFKVGDTAFSADAGKVYVGSFNPVGFTVKQTSPSTAVDAFAIDTIVFAGVQITGSSAIELNTTENYVAAPYPTGTSLPTGEKISWSFSGNSNYLVATVDANDSSKISVKAIKQDSVFASLNQGTLTATVVDAYGFQDYAYTPATFDVAIGTKTGAFKSDTTGDVKLNVGKTYQFKITSLDGKVPGFGLGGNGAAVTSSSVSGKDYFYKVTANKAGDYGVYVNGTRIAILRVSAVSAKIDTTVVTIKVGNTYQFKVTSAAKPNFGLGSSALQTVATSSKGQDYFYKVKAVSGKTGDKVGVYVNGTRAAIATIG